MNKALTLLVAVAVIAVAAGGIVAYQSLTGGGSAAAASDPSRASGTIVVDWNRQLVRIVNTPGAQPATVHPTRSFAILQAAVYDAVVSITHEDAPYLFSVQAPPGARADAAAAEAGRDTLVALYPAQRPALDQQLAAELSAIPDGAAKQAGIRTGALAARLMLAVRSDDGAGAPLPPVPSPTKPGDYRPTPPANAPAVFTQWPAVTPFVLDAADQFRPTAPPDVASAAYAKDANEVKSLGRDSSTARTADQTVTAKFWPGPIWVQWNEIAETSTSNHHLDLERSVRLFAVMDLAFADAVIAFYDAKYHYLRWRPISALRAADTGNPDVVGDPTWTPLLATAPDPAYPGAHSTISAAGAAVLDRFFGKHDRIQVRSDALPGVVRSFDGYDAAASEAGLSRIYGGVHFRSDHTAGLELGQKVAGFVLKESTTPGFGLEGR